MIKEFENNNLSAYDGAALVWYLRNCIYFDLNLKVEKNVLICKYEDLVLEPNVYFKRIFDFLGAKFLPLYVDDIHSNSVKKKDKKTIQPAIEKLCDEMMCRLDKDYEIQLKVKH